MVNEFATHSLREYPSLQLQMLEGWPPHNYTHELQSSVIESSIIYSHDYNVLRLQICEVAAIRIAHLVGACNFINGKIQTWHLKIRKVNLV